jgi:hypothetical protein
MVVMMSAGLMLAGCAPGNYAAPTAAPKRDNERVVPLGFDAAWTRLIDHASQTFFVIDNVAKESGLLTLSFGSDNPAKFIDCGQVKAAWTAASGGGWTGPYAEYARIYLGGTLTGKMNILLQEVDANSTKLRVTARYVFTTPPQRGASGEVWAFDSGGVAAVQVSGAMPGTEPTRVCQPTGVAEAEILKLFD